MRFGMRLMLSVAAMSMLLLPSQTAWSASFMPQVWLAMRVMDTPERRSDWEQLFLRVDAVWPQVLNGVQVISVGQQSVEQLSAEELKIFVVNLERHHKLLSLGVLAQNWDNEMHCGRNVEGYSRAGDNAKIAEKLKQAGAQLSYIGMDEPLYYGHYFNGAEACRSTIEDVGQHVSINLAQYTKVFPGVVVFDTEPLPGVSSHPGWQADYVRWLTTFRAAVGRPISGLNLDLLWTDARWQAGLTSAAELARGQNLSLGIVYWAEPHRPPGGAITNTMWIDSATENFHRIEQGMGVIPDRAMFVSWSKFPVRTISDRHDLGEDELIKRYLQMKGRLHP